jgi:hypothetical protein
LLFSALPGSTHDCLFNPLDIIGIFLRNRAVSPDVVQIPMCLKMVPTGGALSAGGMLRRNCDARRRIGITGECTSPAACRSS